MSLRVAGLCLLVALVVAGCRQQAAEPKAEEPPAAATTATPAPEPAPTRAVTQPSAGPEPQAKLEGVVLNVQDNLQLLKPDGWRQAETAEGGPLVKLVREALVDNVRVNVTLSAATDLNLPENATIAQLKDTYLTDLPNQMAKESLKVVANKDGTLSGRPALAVKADLDSDGHRLRAKQWVAVEGGQVWVLQGIGPRDGFDEKVEPELNAIASTVVLP
jgi:hypothetical protein